MATKHQTELALKALLTELNHSGCDLYELIERTILRMQQEHLYIKEDSHRERGGAEDALFSTVESLVGKRPHSVPGDIKSFDIEDF
ncbi:hypothetical protein ZZ78_02075 [Salmonella enterica subsp. enterica serovar Infantis]|uniref:Uncharacterized protein n=4 Tax=Salmonella enterica TaxID=28901 RepID=A0A762KMC5_SALER|nr:MULTISPECIES: hypothetical protein [Enterobacteriaceae]EBN0111043.1 hypothetical protein [Salmonella enterica subsp. enterica serovar Infantis]EBV2052433.1 hypothetical protein [Salmonella enterica subsp. enterica serovar Braenderup]EBV2358804.1 hypothetical protein [Salmonella enterica subsp. enterica serovar Ago]EBX3117220.1 hypothetical protein [Salmonella enterica subsp. enterica serovar Virchow]ECA0142422.1 hypothetical protein [Salmonella enterica subsp. enterica serovar Colindale]EC